MKRYRILFLLLLVSLLLAGCCREHTWAEATCTAPKTCTNCNKTEGDVLPHSFADATCQAPKTCTVCGAAEGDIGGHIWMDATCTAPKTCSLCSATEGDVIAHTWEDATWHAPKTCTACAATEGTARNFFAVNGLEVEEGLPERMEISVVLSKNGSEANQKVVPGVAEGMTIVKAQPYGYGKVNFVVEFTFTYDFIKGYDRATYDIGIMDLYTGKMVPVDDRSRDFEGLTFELDGIEHNIHHGQIVKQKAGQETVTEDGTTVTPITLACQYGFTTTPGYDGVVWAFASVKHHPYNDQGFLALQQGGFTATDYAKYPDVYEDVHFYHLPVPEVE